MVWIDFEHKKSRRILNFFDRFLLAYAFIIKAIYKGSLLFNLNFTETRDFRFLAAEAALYSFNIKAENRTGVFGIQQLFFANDHEADKYILFKVSFFKARNVLFAKGFKRKGYHSFCV